MRRIGRPWHLGVLLLGAVFYTGLEAPLLTFYRVSGNSMRPAFEDGDRVLVLTLPLLAGGIHAGDPVIAEHDGETLIKRVMAGPGDAFAMHEGIVYVNGAPARDPVPTAFRGRGDFASVSLAGDQYFVLGDNREVSVDSRCIGSVAEGAIVGKILCRFTGGGNDPRTAAARK